jgi:hypothetical protein
VVKKYSRGDVVWLKVPIVEARVGEDHGSSVWVTAGGLAGYVGKSQIEEKR